PLRPRRYVCGPPTTHTYPLSLHDALPISSSSTAIWVERPGPLSRITITRSTASRRARNSDSVNTGGRVRRWSRPPRGGGPGDGRSEEHTSELQSRENLVCRLLLENKNKQP